LKLVLEDGQEAFLLPGMEMHNVDILNLNSLREFVEIDGETAGRSFVDLTEVNESRSAGVNLNERV